MPGRYGMLLSVTSGHPLTQDQIDYFDAFGFLLLRGLFDEATMGPVIQAADALWNEDFGGRPDPTATLHQDRFVERSPVLMPLIDDGRLYDKLQQLLASASSSADRRETTEWRDRQPPTTGMRTGPEPPNWATCASR